MTREPNISEVGVGTTVVVTCSIKSYPGASIRWEKRTLNEYAPVDSSIAGNTSNTFSVITESIIMVTSSDIDGASKYCCEATNIIGTSPMECLDFTERGK